MEAAKSFQDLIVWQKAHAFVMGVYEAHVHFQKKSYTDSPHSSVEQLYPFLPTLLKVSGSIRKLTKLGS